MGNSSRVLLFAFLVVIVFSAILPVSSLTHRMDISSHGTVNYSPNTWNLVIIVTPINGGTTSVSGKRIVSVGQNVTVSATAEQDYCFVNWKFDDVVSTSNPITIPPQPEGTSHSLVASFAATIGKYVGFRCNGVGEYTPEYWASVATKYSSLVSNTTAGGIWLVHQSKIMSFDSATDSALTLMDNKGVKVFLQLSAEPSPGVWGQYAYSIGDMLDNILAKYGKHSCVIGIGIDLEARGTAWNDYVYTTDAEARSWVNKVKAYNSSFKLFLKHWIQGVMPPTVREGIVFVDMAQDFSSGWTGLLNHFKSWGIKFSKSDVAFQVGYKRDQDWWSQLTNPPKYMALTIFQDIPNAKGVYWVGTTAKSVFPESVQTNLAPMPLS